LTARFCPALKSSPHELFLWLTIPAALFLLFELIAGNTFWMRLP